MWKAIIGLNKNNELLKDPKELYENNGWVDYLTKNNPIIIGKNTYMSLFEKLEKKVTIELTSEDITREEKRLCFSNLLTVKSFLDLQIPNSIPFVLGGKTLFDSSLEYCDMLLIYKEDSEEGFSFSFKDFKDFAKIKIFNKDLDIFIREDQQGDILISQLDKLYQIDQLTLKGE